jgi:hypothetical protein
VHAAGEWYLSGAFWTITGTFAGLVAGVAAVSFAIFSARADSRGEAEARGRVRAAESNLIQIVGVGSIGPALAGMAQDPSPADGSAPAAPPDAVQDERITVTPLDELGLSALWEVTHSRLDLYHRIATGQARRSFLAAQVATFVGFVILVILAVLAVRARTTASAIATGGLGAVSAALAGYIGRTFVRSQETAAAHLRAYFDQPLEFSRYLAAERLLASAQDLSGLQRAKILTALIEAIVGPGKSQDHSVQAADGHHRAKD